MPELNDQLPKSVREHSRVDTWGSVPALIVHPSFGPDGAMHESPAPVLLWMHGRTASKELDAGRYLRLMRAGIASVAVDLPGHGARFDEALQQPERTLEVVERMVDEIDAIVAAMQATNWFVPSRVAIGGMSAGGMAALIRLCREHSFAASAVECTTGSFAWQRHRAMFDAPRAARLDPIAHLDAWRAIPMLLLHNTLDAWVAVEGQREFVEALATRGLASAAELHEFPATGAPYEHAGFGRFSSEAKDRQTAFLVKHLRDS